MSPEKSDSGKKFRNRDSHFKIPRGLFWIDSNKKVPKSFVCLPFHRLMTPIFWKTVMSWEKPFSHFCKKHSRNGKKFEIEIVILKCVLDYFESISIKKNNFVFAIFWFMNPIFKKPAMPPRKVIRWKSFRNRYFHLKYILNHSESILIKKIVS